MTIVLLNVAAKKRKTGDKEREVLASPDQSWPGGAFPE